MKFGQKETTALGLVFIIAVVLVIAVGIDLLKFGRFPERQVENFKIPMTYQQALENKEIDENIASQIVDNYKKISENFGKQSISQHILLEAPTTENGTGAANVVTSVLWDYRGYDTIGEATVIFVAVCGVAALFRVAKEEES